MKQYEASGSSNPLRSKSRWSNPLRDNPIVRREWAQWRRGRALWVAPLVLAVALSGLLARFCVVFGPWASGVGAGSAARGPFALGFLGLVSGAMSLLLPLAVAAPSIASEREASLLEGLHLTRLSSAELVLGKWAASFLRSLWLLGAALPVHFAVMLLGGVGARDVLGVWACEVVFAAFSCALGTFCSAWARTAVSATRSAYGFGVLHAVVCFNALSIAAVGRLALIPIPLRVSAPLRSVLAWIGATHPLIAAGISWWQPWRLQAGRTDLAPMLSHPILLWSLVAQAAASALLLALACPALQRPFESRPFIKRRQGKLKAAGKLKAGEGQAPATWWELPLGFLARSRNPVHGRELASKFRMRSVPRVVLASEGVLGLGVAIFYARAFYLGIFDASARPLIWWALLLVGLIVGMTSMLVLGATGIARERELGTWEALQLSFLSPGEVLRGKMSAMLAACVLFSVPFWPLLALCVRGWRSSARGLGVLEAVCSLLILAAMAWSHGALGLWLSARLKSSSATLCAMAGLFAWDLLMPLAIGGASGPRERLLLSINTAFNPVLALLRLMSVPPGQLASATLVPTLALALSGALLLWSLQRRLRREWAVAPAPGEPPGVAARAASTCGSSPQVRSTLEA